MTLAPGVVEILSEIVGRDYMCALPAASESEPVEVRSPWGELPDAVVFPATTDEVVQVLRGAAACRVCVRTPEWNVLFDGEEGQIVLALSRLDNILEINTRELYARVQPAVSRKRLLEAMTAAGMTVVAIPSARLGWDKWADLLAIEVVTPAGQIIRAKRPATGAQVATVDLLAGLAGTLCLSTEVTFALTPRLS